ncbi:MAG: tyrosine-type recombinase/integrase [Sulfuricurvum sp.]
MARTTAPLTDTQILRAKPKDKEYKLFDGKGLYLIVTTKGSKWWRMKYLFNNKENSISLGIYPITTLVEARAKTIEYKKLLKDNISPSNVKKQAKEALKLQHIEKKFKVEAQINFVIEKWFLSISHNLKPITIKKESERLNNHFIKHFATYNEQVFIISSKPIDEIKRFEIVKIITELSQTKAETADRIFGHLNRIWLYAINIDLVENNILATRSVQPANILHYKPFMQRNFRCTI